MEFGDAQYKRRHEVCVRNTTEKVRVANVLEGITLSSRRNFLDIGAGDGDLTFRVFQKFDRTVFVEPNTEMRAAFESRGIEFIGDYFQKTDLKNRKFDLILCSQVFWLVKREAQTAFIKRMYDHGCKYDH